MLFVLPGSIFRANIIGRWRIVRAAQPKILRELETRDLVSGARQADGSGLVLQFYARASDLPEYRESMQLLDLDPEQRVYPFVTGVDAADANAFYVRTWSFAGLMYFLSQSVEVPARDIEAGRVTVTRDATGQPFD